MLFVCATIATFVFAAGGQYAFADNGSEGPELDDPPIVVDAGWSISSLTPPGFTWFDFTPSAQPVFNREGPFTWNHATPSLFSITDDFCTGDVFRIYDFGVNLGATSTPTIIGHCARVGPDVAFDDPKYSSGTFLLGPGAHSITIETIVNPFNGGQGWIKVDSAPFTARELKEGAEDALRVISGEIIFGTPGVDANADFLGFAADTVFGAANRIATSLTLFDPGDPNRLADVDPGTFDVFDIEVSAIDSIEFAVRYGKITNDEILADLYAVIVDLHAADDILAQTALDDATEAGADPKNLENAAMRLDEARAQADACVLLPYDPVDDGVKGNQTEPEGPTCDDAIRSYGRSWGWSN